MLDAVETEIRRGDGPRRVFFTQVTPYLNAPLLQLRLGRGRSAAFVVVDRHLSDELAAAEAELARADFVVAFGESNSAVLPHLPAAAIQPDLLDALARDAEHVLARTFVSPSGDEVLLYARASGFQGIRAIEGLAAAEGPYPELGLPRVRWGVGPLTRVELNVPPPGGGRLLIDARGDFAGQTMQLRVGARRLRDVTLTVPGRFAKSEIALGLEPGLHELEIVHSHWHEPMVTDDRPRAVLFRTLLVLPSP